MIDYPNYIEGQMSLLDLDMQFTKMSLVHSAPTKEKTSELCWKKWLGSSKKESLFLDLRKGSGLQPEPSWVMGIPSHGESSTLNFGESPSVVVESRLSQILQDNPHPKYCLSPKACQGILRRAEKRGKELPEVLKAALVRQAIE